MLLCLWLNDSVIQDMNWGPAVPAHEHQATYDIPFKYPRVITQCDRFPLRVIMRFCGSFLKSKTVPNQQNDFLVHFQINAGLPKEQRFKSPFYNKLKVNDKWNRFGISPYHQPNWTKHSQNGVASFATNPFKIQKHNLPVLLNWCSYWAWASSRSCRRIQSCPRARNPTWGWPSRTSPWRDPGRRGPPRLPLLSRGVPWWADAWGWFLTVFSVLNKSWVWEGKVR